MNIWRDFCFGLRLLVKKPGFTIVAVLALALGIGPNTALFSIIHSVFYESMGFPEGDRLVMVWYRHIDGDTVGRGSSIAAGDILEYQKVEGIFESMTAYGSGRAVYSGEGEPEEIRVLYHTPGHFNKTYKRPILLGRDFLPEEAEPGNDKVIFLHHHFWQASFGGDPDIIGKQIPINRELYTVVGVMPKPNVRALNDGFLPLKLQPPQTSRHGMGGYWVVARLNPGVTIEQAQAALDGVAHNLAQAYPKTNKDIRISVDQHQAAWIPRQTLNTLWLLGGAVGFVLLIACANVASLMLARATTRQREIAIRGSLGATGKRLFRQVLIESLTLSLAGCVAGAALGWGLLRILLAKAPAASLTVESDPRLSLTVLLFTTCIALFAGVLFGTVPAWNAGRQNLKEALKLGAAASSGVHHLWLRRGLVVFEFAAAMTLLAGASICFHTLWKRTGSEAGIRDPENIMIFNYMPPQARMTTLEAATAFYREAMSAIESVPGVESVGAADGFPMRGLREQPFEFPGNPPAPDGTQPTAGVVHITNGYFDTYGIPILRGRGFEDSDRSGGEPVMMVSEEFARRYLPDQDPLTQQVALEEPVMGQKESVTVVRRIVGVYQDIYRVRQSGGSNEPEIAVPIAQYAGIAYIIAVRAKAGVESLQQPIAKALAKLAPDAPMRNTTTVAAFANDMVERERNYVILFGLMAGIALLLSAVGIYGVMAFLVAQRTKEIGLRMALGAGRERIITLVFKEGLILAAVGLAIGFAGAFFASRSLQAVLAEVQRLDYLALGAAASILLLCALGACFAPAFRASKVDPMDSLRLN